VSLPRQLTRDNLADRTPVSLLGVRSSTATLLHILLLALRIDHSKIIALVATRAVVHVMFDAMIAVLLARSARKGSEGEGREKEVSLLVLLSMYSTEPIR